MHVREVSVNESDKKNQDKILETLQQLVKTMERMTERQPVSVQGSSPTGTGLNEQRGNQRREWKCYHCQEVGHIKRNCPVLRREINVASKAQGNESVSTTGARDRQM